MDFYKLSQLRPTFAVRYPLRRESETPEMNELEPVDRIFVSGHSEPTNTQEVTVSQQLNILGFCLRSQFLCSVIRQTDGILFKPQDFDSEFFYFFAPV